LAATVDCNSRYVYLNPYEGAKAAVAEAARNLSCVGALPLAVTDNLNFGSPEKPVGYWQLAEACRGLADACREFETPVTGGNVSLYNETVDSQGNPQPIYPTPVVGMVGLIEDLSLTCGQGWSQTGDLIYLLGVPVEQTATATLEGWPLVTLGGSEYLVAVHQKTTGHPPAVDMALEKQVQSACRYGIAQGWVQSAHDSAEGGLAVALAESCISGQRGAVITLPLTAGQTEPRWDRLLFGEGGARILVSVSLAHQQVWEAYLTQHLAGQWQRLGTVQGEALTLTTQDGQIVIDEVVERLAQIWGTAIRDRLAV
jgi:phosphoribosylformylglycinamidine synthase